jgi:nucleoside-diphosphate-sugar epimerase
MKVLVTGASGFIGRWTVEKMLDEGYETMGLDLVPSPAGSHARVHHQVDLLDAVALQRSVREFQPEVVIHLAARTDLGGRNLDDYAVNIAGVRNLVTCVRRTQSVRRVLYTSSQLVCRVGYRPRGDTDYQPSTVYGESKVCTEEIVRESDGGGVEWAICRPTTVWGPHMNEHYRQFLRYIDSGRYFHVSRRKLFKSYSYIGNIAWQYLKLATAQVSQMNRRTFYLADYEPLSLRDYADALQRELGAKPIRTYPYLLAWLGAKMGDALQLAGVRRVPFNSFRLRNIMTEYQLDTNLTRSVCGPLPYTSAAGIKATAKWYRELTKRN